jgi:hypothetical protein
MPASDYFGGHHGGSADDFNHNLTGGGCAGVRQKSASSLKSA